MAKVQQSAIERNFQGSLEIQFSVKRLLETYEGLQIGRPRNAKRDQDHLPTQPWPPQQ